MKVYEFLPFALAVGIAAGLNACGGVGVGVGGGGTGGIAAAPASPTAPATSAATTMSPGVVGVSVARSDGSSNRPDQK